MLKVIRSMMKSARLRVSSFLGAALRNSMQPGGFTKLFLCLCVSVLLGAAAPVVNWSTLEKDKKAPSDYGYGPGKSIGTPRPKIVLGQVPPSPKTAARAAAPNRAAAPIGAAAPATAPNGGGVGGFFGAAFPWPIIPLHVAL